MQTFDNEQNIKVLGRNRICITSFSVSFIDTIVAVETGCSSLFHFVLIAMFVKGISISFGGFIP